MITARILLIICSVALPAANAAAQSNNPSSDWNGSYQFRSPQQMQIRLLEAEMIERKSNDYYAEFGRTNATVYYNTTVEGDQNNDSSRTITNNFPDGYDQPLDQSETSTTAVGALNTTTIDISNGSNVSINSSAGSTGCQDGAIRTSSSQGGLSNC